MYGKSSELQTKKENIRPSNADRAEVLRIFSTQFERVDIRMVHANVVDRPLLHKIMQTKHQAVHIHLAPCCTDADYTNALSAIQRFMCTAKSVVSKTTEHQGKLVQCNSLNDETCVSRMNAYIPVPVLPDYADTLLLLISKAGQNENTEIVDVMHTPGLEPGAPGS